MGGGEGENGRRGGGEEGKGEEIRDREMGGRRESMGTGGGAGFTSRCFLSGGRGGHQYRFAGVLKVGGWGQKKNVELFYNSTTDPILVRRYSLRNMGWGGRGASFFFFRGGGGSDPLCFRFPGGDTSRKGSYNVAIGVPRPRWSSLPLVEGAVGRRVIVS